MSDILKQSAVAKALDRLSRHKGTIAAVAVLAPLGLPAPALALVVSTIGASTVVTTSGNVTTFKYTISNFSGSEITAIEIPELNAGDFNLSSFSYTGGNNIGSWSVKQETTASVLGSFKNSALTPGAFVLLSENASGEGISSGTSTTFTLTSTVSGTVAANFGARSANGTITSIDPPVPGTPPVTAVPEPASIALLGGAVALALTRARRRV